MPKRKLQVFISSTFTDLQIERQAAVAAILKAGHIPAGMELFTPGDESQWQTITRWIDESDIYMLILGGRYGTTHPESGLGYTEMEYDYAVAAGKPFFAVAIEEGALVSREKSRGAEVVEIKNPEKLAQFRAKVLGRISGFFHDAKDIKLAVHETISTLDQKHNPTGWISGAEFVDNKPLVEKLTALSEENRKLSLEIFRLTQKLEKVKIDSDEDFLELADTLGAIEITVPSFSEKASRTKPKKSNLLDIFYSIRDALTIGVTNSFESSESETFIYQKIATKLQVYELVENEKVAGVRWRRSFLTKRGGKFLAYLERTVVREKLKTPAAPAAKSANEAGSR